MAELVVSGGVREGQALILTPPGPYVLGRSLQCDFQLPDRLVSRRHYSIEPRDEGYLVRDLDSKSGTFVGGVRVRKAVLKPGDEVRAGNSTAVLRLGPEDPLVGRDLGGYRLLERVGRGGMGTVYRAVQTSLRRIVALKVLDEELAADPGFRSLFVEEARAAAELSHPHIVRVYDVDRLEGILFYAMEFTARGSVEDRIRARLRLDVTEALDIALQTARGLAFAETTGLVHRDIKPANLMVASSGAIKIGDLGIATRAHDDAERPTLPESPLGAVSGSPPYMSPEQVLGRPVDHRGDLYSLGASLHEMLAGLPPYRGDTAKDVLWAHVRERPPPLVGIRPDVPQEVSDLVLSLLAKRPDDRPASAVQVVERLAALLATERAREERTARRSRWRPPPWLPRVAVFAGLAAVGYAAASRFLDG